MLQKKYFASINYQNLKSYCNIFKLNENEFVTLSVNDKHIKFWDLNYYSNILLIILNLLHWKIYVFVRK